VEHMREAVRIEKMLGVIGTANLARPDLKVSAGANPQTSFQAKENGDSNEKGDDRQRRPKALPATGPDGGLSSQLFSRPYLSV